MSITYEQALETLETMFGAPWTRESLDLVLRHFQGHMENTVEAVLSHGDQSPALLLENLKQGKSSTMNQNTDLDQQLARQLAAQDRQAAATAGGATASSTTPKGRGTPTTLPPDFLRVPGYQGRGGTGHNSTTTSASTLDQDEALARMLQDEMFSQELANNPEFAHLARPRTSGGMPTRHQQQGSSRFGVAPPANRFKVDGGNTTDEGPKIIEKITEMGQEAKKRLQILAAQWNAAGNRFAANVAGGGGGTAAAGGGIGGTSALNGKGSVMTMNETRGLLDENNDDEEEEMEMSFAKTKNQ